MNQVDILTRQYNEAVKFIQDNYQHENTSFKYGASTGNWFPEDDAYWKDYKCPDCNKQWRVYSK